LAADGFACRPCYRRTCDQPVFCLETVEGRQVLATARELLRRVGAATGGNGP
jgi:hypothetical protein